MTSVGGEDGAVEIELSLNILCSLWVGEGGGEGIPRRVVERIFLGFVSGVNSKDASDDTGDRWVISSLADGFVISRFFLLLSEADGTAMTSSLSRAARNTRSASSLVENPW